MASSKAQHPERPEGVHVNVCVCVGVQCLYINAICIALKDGIAVCVYH